MIPTLVIFRLERHDVNWPWVLKSKTKPEEVTMDQVWASMPERWAVMMNSWCPGSQEYVEYNYVRYGHQKMSHLPTRLVTTSPDKLARSVFHWQYHENPEWADVVPGSRTKEMISYPTWGSKWDTREESKN